ncbi:MAG: polyprenyl synthetase family protein [Jatrophihabitans sp.]|nr:MAG: polyprenyl synthetase family protein [Jatrophihabitans sp.]
MPIGLFRRVDGALTAFLDDRAVELAAAGPEPGDLIALARTALRGGKRLRPCFAYWGWRAACGEPEPDDGLVALAASLELLHTCALVQDDVMDGSQRRRGRPAAHRELARLCRIRGWSGDADRFGRSAATLLGDLLLTWADSVFAAAPVPAAQRPAARQVYENMRQLVMAGQYLDLVVHARGGFSVDDTLRVAAFKTGSYTVEGPLQLGAAAAGAPPAVRAALTRYAVPLGEAFQLRDDVLGVFGDAAVTGKPVGDDLREGKRTLLVALAVASAGPSEANLLRTGLGDPALSESDVVALRALIVATGALAEVERRIAAGRAMARVALRGAPLAAAAINALDDLAVQVTARDR